ncbi:MAG: sialate O-acetylesterase [Gemmataceae bacterium]
MKTLLPTIATTLLVLALYNVSQAKCAQNTVKVFILAGQSNMVGQASNKLLEHQATAPKTKKVFAHLRKDGKWVVRNDVFIKFFERHGGLTIGYGQRGHTGPALQFGTVVGDHFDEPVLIIKTAWGGHSLYRDFRPPSAGLPSEEKLKAQLEQAQKRVLQRNKQRKRNDPLPTMKDITAGYGKTYRMMIEEIENTLENYEKLFPKLKGKKLEVAGFVWFQGWNDQYNGAETEYAANMKFFIKDVRKDLKAPNMPVVIAMMGQNGSTPAKGAMLTIQQAQASMETITEFKGNVKAFRTDVLVDKAAEELYPMWRQRFKEWELIGSDHRYHYLGSAIWFHRIGQAMGKNILELMGQTTSKN